MIAAWSKLGLATRAAVLWLAGVTEKLVEQEGGR